ncbi:hypothetical protein LXL04_017558 [Taraxacum kok-saghyz]
MEIRRVGAQEYLLLKSLKGLGLYPDNVVYIINEDVKKKNDVKKRVSFNLENNTVHIIPDDVHDVLHDSEENKSPDVVEEESCCSENEVVKSESEDTHSESDVSSSSSDSFQGMKPYRKPVLQDVQKYETQNYVPKPYDVQIPKCDLHFRNTNSYLKPRNSKKKKKKRKVKKIWIPKVKNVEKVQKIVTKSVVSRKSVTRWRDEKKFQCWYNVIIDNFCFPTKEPKRSISVYSEYRLFSPSKGVNKIDTVQFRTLANFRNDSQIFMFCDELGIFSQISLRKGERCYFKGEFCFRSADSRSLFVPDLLLAYLCLIHDSDYNSAPSFRFGIQQVVSELKLEDLIDYFKSRSEMTNSVHESHSVLQVLIVEDSMEIRRVGAQEYLLLKSLKGLGLYPDNVVYIINEDVKKKNDVKKRVSFNLENNTVHIIPDDVHDVLHDSEENKSPDVVEEESCCSENEVVKSESEDTHSESDVSSSSSDSFQGMKPYRKPVLQDVQKYETQNYVPKPYDVQIPKCDLHFRNTNSYLKPRNSKKKKKKRKVKKIWIPKVKNVEKVQKIVTKSVVSRKSVTRWRDEKKFQCWYNVIIDNFCFPTKEPKRSISVYSEDRLFSPSKGVNKIDTVQFRTLANFRNDSQIFMFCDELGIFSQISLRKGERCYFKGEFCFRSADSRSLFVPDLLLAYLCLIHDSDYNSAPSFRFGIQQVVSELKLEDLIDYFKSRSEMTNSVHESHSVLQVLIVEDSMEIRRVGAQEYLLLKSLKGLGLYPDNVVYIINEDVKKKNDVKKRVSFNLENNTVHIIPDDVHDVLHDSEENKSPDVVEEESCCSENEVVKSESEDTHSESDVSSSSSDSFQGMKPYRKPVLQDVQKYETQNYVPKPYDVQIPKCDLHFRNTNSYLKPTKFEEEEKEEEKPKRSISVYSEDRLFSPSKGVNKIDTVQFRTLANFRNDSQIFMFCDELGIFSQISLRKGERCYFKGEFCFRSADSRSLFVPDLLLAYLCLIHDSDYNSAPSFRFGIQQVVSELKLEDLIDYFKSRSEMTNSVHESHSVLQVLIVEDSMEIRRVGAQEYLLLKSLKGLGLYPDNVVYIINEDVKKKNDVKKRVSFNLENNTVHIIPDDVHDVLHDSEENKSPDVVEEESCCSENEVVKSESEDTHSESDVSSSSSDSFQGMKPYRKPVLQDVQKYETQNYVPKPYDVQIPKCDLHFRNTNSYLKPRNSKKKKKKRKVKKIWIPKVKNVEKVQKIVTKSVVSRKSVTRWRDEKKFQCWYNVIIDNFCFPTKEPKRSISVYSEDRLFSPSKGVNKIDTVQFRTLANFRNDSQIFMFCDELGIFSQISLRKGERCYFKGEFCFRSADSRSLFVPDLLLAYLCLIHDSDYNSAPSFRFGIQQVVSELKLEDLIDYFKSRSEMTNSVHESHSVLQVLIVEDSMEIRRVGAQEYLLLKSLKGLGLYPDNVVYIINEDVKKKNDVKKRVSFNLENNTVHIIPDDVHDVLHDSEENKSPDVVEEESCCSENEVVKSESEDTHSESDVSSSSSDSFQGMKPYRKPVLQDVQKYETQNYVPKPYDVQIPKCDLHFRNTNSYLKPTKFEEEEKEEEKPKRSISVYSEDRLFSPSKGVNKIDTVQFRTLANFRNDSQIFMFCDELGIFSQISLRKGERCYFKGEFCFRSADSRSLFVPDLLLAYLCLIHDSDYNSAPSFRFGIQQVVSELKLEDLIDYFKSRSEMTNSVHESHSVLQVLIVEDSMEIRRVGAQEYLLLKSLKGLGLYPDNVVYIINEDVKKKNDVKKRVSFNLENNTVHIIPDDVHDVLHDSEENKSPDVVEEESCCSENEVVKSESEDTHSESDVSSSSSDSFQGMKPYRKPVLQDVQKYETQNYVPKPYDVQIPKCDLHFRNTNSYLKPRNSKKKKKKRKVKKIWIPKVKNVEKVQKIVTKSVVSRKSVTRWRDEKKFQCWYNVIIDNFCFPTKEPKRSISVYSEDRLFSPSKGVNKIDTVQFRTLANFRNDSQIFMFCDELGIFSQISLRKGERCYFKGEFCFRSADSRSLFVPDLFPS